MPKELVSMRVGENFLKSIRRSEGKIIFNFFVTNFIENSRSMSEKAADIKICYDYRSKHREKQRVFNRFAASNRLIRFKKNLFRFKEYMIYKGISMG